MDYFPDPQMKKTNKRLTSTRFMKEYSRILKPEGRIHLKTDSDFLYMYTKAMIEENGLEVLLTQTICIIRELTTRFCISKLL